MILFSENITNRLRYVCDFIGNEILSEPIHIINDKSQFQSSGEAKINYTNQKVSEHELQIIPHSLLFEDDIKPQQIQVKLVNGNKAFFVNNEADFPFDILAATFYLLSRYEEYLPHEKDEYGRFSQRQFIAWSEGFLHIPIINIWLEDFKSYLRAAFRSLQFHRKNFKFIRTYDIDIAWKYKHEGWIRNVGGCVKSILNGKWTLLNERIAVFSDNRKDPFEAYEWLDALHLYCRMKPYYFFLLSEN